MLASRSPRRRSILAQAGIPFEVVVPGVPEDNDSGPPGETVGRHALAKALDVSPSMPGRLVLGADTLVQVGGRVLGKPADRAEACRMLSMLSGAWHEVYGGVALAGGPLDRPACFVEVTRVLFRSLSSREIEEYAATGEPLDKAGAYGIQGFGSLLVERIDGCFYNVMGLPVARMVETLRGLLGAGD